MRNIKSIAFNAPMIQALLDGRKTQTRRVVRPQPEGDEMRFSTTICSSNKNHAGKHRWVIMPNEYTIDSKISSPFFSCPYGKPGGLLWVKEPWQAWTEFNERKASQIPSRSDVNYIANENIWDARRRDARHMPHWASRITLETTRIRVERLQDISEEDAIAEGCRPYWNKENPIYLVCPNGSKLETHPLGGPQEDFQRVWASIYGPEAWDANLWVWVISFNVHKMNVDDFLKMEEDHV